MSRQSPETEPRGRVRWSLMLRLLAIVSFALLLFSAFHPIAAADAAWVAAVPLLLLARFTGPGRAFIWGLGGWLLFWLLSLSWLLRLTDTGGVPMVLICLGWAMLATYCSLYGAAFCAVAAHVFRRCPDATAVDPGAAGTLERAMRRGARGVGLVFLLPLLWVGFEYLRSNMLTGFAWHTLGVSQYSNLAVVQAAEWGGVYAVSWVVMTMNVALALTVLRFVAAFRRQQRTRFHVELMVGLLLCALFWVRGVRRARAFGADPQRGERVRIAAIQPNIPQTQKWTTETVRNIYNRLSLLTELAVRVEPDLVVWPETAVPSAINGDPAAREFVESTVRGGVPLLVGSLEEVERDLGRYHNSSFLIGTNGETLGVYRKQHLVLFGEYIPLEEKLPILMRLSPLGWSCVPGDSNTVFRLPLRREAEDDGKPGSRDVAFSVLICFEDTVSGLSRRAVREGARFLVVQTNDAWFDGSAGAEQHMAHCVFRAVESRVPIVRVANSGVTCLIDRAGRVRALETEGRRTEFAGFHPFELAVPTAGDADTFYARHGDSLLGLPAGILAGGWFLLVLAQVKRENCRGSAKYERVVRSEEQDD